MACTYENLFQSYEQCPGEVFSPGIARRVYAVRKSDIVKWPTIERTNSKKEGLTPDELANYAGNFTLAADTKWLFIDVIKEKSKITSETQGEKYSKTFLNKAELVLAGTSSVIKANAAYINNNDMVFLIQGADKRFVVLGCDEYDAAMAESINVDSGAAATDANTSTFTLAATDFVSFPYYPGEIDTESGKISGVDGSPIVAP